ncbi:hypothetical protein V5F59_01655 [Xanthobacter autotrophicus DSM 431]|uniref:hypothetical protein n=1 Tax=Xanthobacter nonsaccharivorans TaxID=3119912 RepID=UPI00372C6CD3
MMPDAIAGTARRGHAARLMLAGAVLAGFAGPALALMPPYVYETARREAKSIIVIEVSKVDTPRREFGTCTVAGTVKVVERGEAFRPGQTVQLAVPCERQGASPPLGGTIYQQMEKLAQSRFGRAWLDAEGKVVVSQYEQLAALP